MCTLVNYYFEQVFAFCILLENARSEADVMKDLDISEADIDAAEDVEIE